MNQLITTYAAPCAGAGAGVLELLVGHLRPRIWPLTGWMGGKRRYAPSALETAGVKREHIRRVILADAGPYGIVWAKLLDPETGLAFAHAVRDHLRAWSKRFGPVELWDWLRDQGPIFEDDQETIGPAWVAQWLWLQARAGGGVPVWWERLDKGGHRLVQHSRTGIANAGQNKKAWRLVQGERPTSGSGQVKNAGQKGASGSWTESPGTDKSARGRVNIEKMGDEVLRFARELLATGVEFICHHGDMRDLDWESLLGPEAVVWFDPPYAGCTGYPVNLAREETLAFSRRLSSTGATVLVSEQEPLDELLNLPVDGSVDSSIWYAQELTSLGRKNSKPEWLTLNRAPQLQLGVKKYRSAMAICPKCELMKPVVEGFGVRRMKRDGVVRSLRRQPWCKACRSFKPLTRAPKVLSFGGGVNSTALLVGLVERQIPIDRILFADTGGERPDVHEGIARASAWAQARGYPAIETVHYVVARAHRGNQPGDVVTLEQDCLDRNRLPSLAYGFKSCSERWKQRPIDKALRPWEPAKQAKLLEMKVVQLVGIDADESHRAKAHKPEDPYAKEYPLLEWDWGREECLEAIERVGLGPCAKSACFFCPATTEPEIVQLGRLYPTLLERALAIEDNAESNTEGITPSLRGRIGRPWREVWKAHLAGEKIEGGKMGLPTEIPCGCFDG